MSVNWIGVLIRTGHPATRLLWPVTYVWGSVAEEGCESGEARGI